MKILFILLLLLFAEPVRSQVRPVQLMQFLLDDAQLKRMNIKYPAHLRGFYHCLHYQPVWTDSSTRQKLLGLFMRAAELGLNSEDYNIDPGLAIEGDSNPVETELRLSASAVHFTHDLVYGNRVHFTSYNGLNYSPDCINISSLLAGALINNRINELPVDAAWHTPEYDSLQSLIVQYSQVIRTKDFSELNISSAKVSTDNYPLMVKLAALGLIDSADQRLTSAEVKAKVKLAQKQFDVLADGSLRSTSLEALNVPLAARLKELSAAINTLRWLYCIRQQQKIIVVNIPSATLRVYDGNNILLESKVVVGKRSTPTATICSRITEVILYPYWMVPRSIATKELLPHIKRNPVYLEANNYQVINAAGRVVDPGKIDWQSLSVSNFPYHLRQATGCDNSLGLVKLNFQTPFDMYLHDTPFKSYFNFNKRYFSHGCIRVEKAFELAHMILSNNSIAIDTLTEKGCIYNQSPVTVAADESIPVFVLYNTAWTDSSGQVRFYEDIYKRNKE